MPLSFVQPGYLWLLLLLLPIWALTLVDQRRIARWRRWLSLGLRTVIMVALVLALAGVQVLRHGARTTTVFVLDHSDSVSPTLRAAADQFVQTALEHMPAEEQAAVVVFGGTALVDRPPSTDRPYTRIATTPASDRTNIEDALQLAAAILPAETRKRIILLSDGAENQGNALDASALTRAIGAPVDTVTLVAPPSAADVALQTLAAPAVVREGQQVGLLVEADSGRATTAQLQVRQNRQVVLETTVELQAGLNRIPVGVPAPAPGFHAWEARVDAPDDPVATNNVQFGFSEVRGPPRVLLVEGAPGRAVNLEAGLAAAQLHPVTVAPGDMPATLADLQVYDVVVLVDVPLRALPERTVELLAVYVRELGHGLLMVGGEDSYAAGGYGDTPVEAALPVTMQVPGVKIQPDVALVLVIDRSGSMAGAKLNLAKEGAAQSYATLAEHDRIGVIAFDDSATWAVPLRKKPPSDDFLQQLGSIGGGGGTDLRPGLEQATAALEQTEASVKHIVLLTDGQASRNYDDVAQRMRAAGITLTTVGIEDYDPHLREVAPQTGGRFYEVQDLNDVPRLFFDESLRIARRGIVEREFAPTIAFPSSAVRDLQAVPPLYGYNAVTPKETAQVVLQSDEGDPILAQWQYGLGRAAAWTSDMKGQWARDWVRWDRFGRFAGQLIAELLPAPNVDGWTAEARAQGTALALDLRAEAAAGQRTSGLTTTGRLIKPDGTLVEVPLSEVEPGRYRGTTSLPEAGVYRVQFLIEDAGGQALGVVSTGAVVPPSAEYLQRDGNVALLNMLATRTGGRPNVRPEQVWEAPPAATRRPQPLTWPLLWLAALLWPLDVAVRRLLLPQPRVPAAWLRRAGTAVSRQPTPVRADLQRARAQAVQRNKKAVGSQPPEHTAGTSEQSAASSPATANTGAQLNWRTTRRGIVQRPGQHPQDKL